MNISLGNFVAVLAVSVITTLSACGGGGGGGNSGSSGPTFSGNTSPATIDATNAEVISTGSSEASTRAITNEEARESNPFGISISSSSNFSDQIIAIARYIATTQTATLNAPQGVTAGPGDFGDDPDYCGGTVTLPDNFGQDGTLNGTLIFNNFCYADGDGGQIVMNGTLIFTDNSTTFAIQYVNFQITYNGETQTVNTTFSCSKNSSGAFTSCETVSDYVSSDGSTHRISNFSVSGNNSAGYTVSATYYHSTFGSVSITTTSPIFFNCPAGNFHPSSGTISFTGDAGTSGNISFDSCESYTYCYSDGGSDVCDTGFW